MMEVAIANFAMIKQGAEARIYQGTYLGRTAIIKERFVKTYRHQELDTHLTKERMKAEARAIVRCKSVGIHTPTIYLVDFDRRRIYMEYFPHSVTANAYIAHAEKAQSAAECVPHLERLARAIGRIVARMHANNIVHGDLTTSNILLVGDDAVPLDRWEESLRVTLIDFGLAHLESNAEDKGVDLYVLERALLSTHKTAPQLLPIILESYRQGYKKGAGEVMGKFEEVRARGRKRTMVG